MYDLPAINKYLVEVIPTNINKESMQKAIKFTNYAWFDILIAFREIGIIPTEQEEGRIKAKIALRKYKYFVERM